MKQKFTNHINTTTWLFGSLLSAGVLAKPVDAVLRLKSRVSMAELARSVTDPSSSRYGVFYTPSEIRKIAAPSNSEYSKAIADLKREGFQIVSESPTHLWVSVRADSSVMQSVFAAQFAESVSGASVLKLVSNPEVPEHLDLIESVNGLDTTRKSHPKHHVLSHVLQVGTAAPGGISQDTIKTAYGFDSLYKSGLSGAGQHVAIATYDGFKIEDVRAFYTLSKLSPVPTVDQVTFNGTPNYVEGSSMETALDAEFSGMIAPGAQVHVFASAANSDAGEMQMFTAILDDARMKVVNYSWGDCETHVAPAHQKEMQPIFDRAVAQGVNIFVASGDSGSDSCQDGTTAGDWPAANPSVVAVGGTTFSYTGSKLSETGWSGSGGGVSALFDLPKWQLDAGLASPFVRRSYPDVSFNADPQSGQAVYTRNNGQLGWFVIGGTSMAAPQWSGFMALVGEARAKNSKGALGFLNPLIYAQSATDRAATFNDTKSGSNGVYSAKAGWDAVTGYGSMQAASLLQYLSR